MAAHIAPSVWLVSVATVTVSRQVVQARTEDEARAQALDAARAAATDPTADCIALNIVREP